MATMKGGDKLEAALRAIASKISNAGTLKVGFWPGATYPDGTSVPLVAALNEFGRTVKSKHGDYYQLPRPFFRNMIAANRASWPGTITKILQANGYDARNALLLTGEIIKGQLQQSITDLTSPPLAQSTIDRKGFSKPLIDTGRMRQSVDYKVDDKP